MKGEFVILLNGKLVTYDDYDKIPESFDNVIKFSPDYPPGPHTEEQHEYIEQFVPKLKELIKREKGYHGRSNKIR